MNQDFLLAEYREMRGEILARAKMLHAHLLFAVAVIVVSILTITGLTAQHADTSVIHATLLSFCLASAFVTMSYQANQASLESVARYVDSGIMPHVKQDITWDQFYAGEKKKFVYVSFLKVMPLLAPAFLPLFLVFTDSHLLVTPLTRTLFWAHLFFLVSILFNFRYKLPHK